MHRNKIASLVITRPVIPATSIYSKHDASLVSFTDDSNGFYSWTQLLKGWIANTIQWITQYSLVIFIKWTLIYLLDGTLHPSNN